MRYKIRRFILNARRFRAIFYCSGLLVVTDALAASDKCQIKKVDLTVEAQKAVDGGTAQTAALGKFKITFKESKAGHRIGTILNSMSSKSCNFDYDDGRGPRSLFYSEKKERVFWSQEFASGDEVFIYQLRDCRKIVPEGDFETVRFLENGVASEGRCEPMETGSGKCFCSSSKVYSLDDNCNLVPDANASALLTKKILGSEKGGVFLCSSVRAEPRPVAK